MSLFRLEIQTDNAAFGDTHDERNAELAKILRDTAKRLEQGAGAGVIRDTNGNRVGMFSPYHDSAALTFHPDTHAGYRAAKAGEPLHLDHSTEFRLGWLFAMGMTDDELPAEFRKKGA